jgi:ABC-2 type transport system permease protein
MTTTTRDPSLLAPGGTTLTVVNSLARRNLVNISRLPSAFIPSLVMPIFLTIAFSGAFSAITRLPTFPTHNSLDWFMPLAAIQGSSFGGIGVAFGAVRDLETKFFDRLLMAPAPRSALLLGPMLAGAFRALPPVVLVTTVGFIGGASLPGGPLGLVTLLAGCLGLAVISCGWGLGLAYRIRSNAAGALAQVGIFFIVFLSSAQTPLSVMRGWLHGVARVNPMTNVLRLAREGFLGNVTWGNTWGGLVAIAVIAPLSVLFAIRGLRKVVP